MLSKTSTDEFDKRVLPANFSPARDCDLHRLTQHQTEYPS